MNWVNELIGMLTRGDAVVRVVVASLKGSGPREPGATLLVTAHTQHGTIGGGHLEWKALEIARNMLGDALKSRALQRFPLGATLGQCCGGAVELLFDRYDAAELPLLRELSTQQQSSLRTPFGEGARVIDSACTASVRRERESLIEPLQDRRTPLWIFGAGHVAKALVKVLDGLPFRIVWVDTRAEEFPADVSPEIEMRITDNPEAELEDAPPAAFFIVLTHDHQLDFALVRSLLKRPAGFIGMIGSDTKALRFRQRLSAMGVPPQEIARLNCPLGKSAATSKLPQAIAIAIAAQLLDAQASAASQIRRVAAA